MKSGGDSNPEQIIPSKPQALLKAIEAAEQANPFNQTFAVKLIDAAQEHSKGISDHLRQCLRDRESHKIADMTEDLQKRVDAQVQINILAVFSATNKLTETERDTFEKAWNGLCKHCSVEGSEGEWVMAGTWNEAKQARDAVAPLYAAQVYTPTEVVEVNKSLDKLDRGESLAILKQLALIHMAETGETDTESVSYPWKCIDKTNLAVRTLVRRIETSESLEIFIKKLEKAEKPTIKTQRKNTGMGLTVSGGLLMLATLSAAAPVLSGMVASNPVAGGLILGAILLIAVAAVLSGARCLHASKANEPFLSFLSSSICKKAMDFKADASDDDTLKF